MTASYSSRKLCGNSEGNQPPNTHNSVKSKQKGQITYSFGDTLEHEVGKGLEVLWLQVVLVLHHIDLEIDQTCISQYRESSLPAAEESVRFLLQDADFADAGEVIVQNLFHKGWVPLLHLLLESLVPHQNFLLLHALDR